MSLKKILIGSYGMIIIGIIMISIMLLFIVNSQESLVEAQDNRYKSYLLADELRQSSDDLTRLARTYVISEDDKYEKMYWDILAIRNGQKPRPENAERIYWDFVLEYGHKPRPDDKTVALQDLMKEAGFTEEEFTLLKQAQANSDGLVTTETIAMNAIKGLYDDGKGNYNIKSEPEPVMARKIMHDDQYHIDKAKIMGPIDQFFKKLNVRTSNLVADHQKHTEFLLWIAQLLVLLLILFSIGVGYYVFKIIFTQVGGEPQNIGEISKAVAVGDINVDYQEGGKDLTGIFEELKLITASFKNRAKLIENISDGNLSTKVEILSDKDVLGFSLKKMVQSLKEKVLVAKQISNGDLSVDVNLVSKNDDLGIALKTMGTNLNDTVKRVIKAIEQFSSGTKDVTSSSQELAEGATEQASAVEQVSSSMEEMVANIQQNADNAQKTNTIAQETYSNAQESGTAVTQSVEAMKQISEKISIIEEIARQTNLLALNAAIEAARAGDHGKGFAVVASQVRSLAKNSQKAAGDITKLTQSSVEIAEVAGNMLEKLIPDTKQTANLIQEISAASIEQHQGAEEVNRAIQQMDQVIQQNALSAERLADTANNLSSQSNDLLETIGFFKTEKKRPNLEQPMTNEANNE